ncbi:MAG: hypothetical protein EHM64_02845 [Ignavibacteriae bacterium]|nr:MAG: hypothetical protein EHM64_02845 [Ignavibacteriota bacterium]
MMMNIPAIKYQGSRLAPHVFTPLAIALFILAMVNTLQTFMLYRGDHSAGVLFALTISKLFYSWYYLLLAAAIHIISRHLHFTRRHFAAWMGVHCSVLAVSLFLHQTLSHAMERVMVRDAVLRSTNDLILNNPAVWLDVVVYGLFLLTFSLMEHQTISQNNEIKYRELEVQLLKSQLNELRSSIHPQFLFHTLQNITHLLDRRQNKKANDVLSQLCNYLRKTLYDNDREEIPLNEELEFLRQFISIERMRFPGGLVLQEQNGPGIGQTLVPNFILQPIVEAMIDHGFQRHGKSYELDLQIHHTGNQLIIRIAGRCAGKAPLRKTTWNAGALVALCRERLTRLYNSRQKIQMNQTPQGGVEVELNIPFHTEPITRDSPLLQEQTT